MATIRIPVKIVWTGAGSPGVNVWHARTDGSGGPSDALGILTGFYTACLSLYSNDTLIILGEDIVDIGSAPPTYVSATRTELVGTGGTGDAPPALQMVVTWRTTVATRRGRGRTFLGPLNSTVMGADGTINGVDRTVLANAAADLVAESKASLNGAIGVYSSIDRVIRDVDGFTTGDTFAVLRSRRD